MRQLRAHRAKLGIRGREGTNDDPAAHCVLVRRDGHESPIEDSAAPIHDRGGHVAGMVVVFHDVSEVQAMAQRMTHLAEHDISRHSRIGHCSMNRLEQGIALAQRHSRRLAVLFIDLTTSNTSTKLSDI